MGVGGIQFETGAGADADLQNFLMRAVRKILKGFPAAGFQSLAEDKIIKRRVKRIKPLHVLAIYFGFGCFIGSHW